MIYKSGYTECLKHLEEFMHEIKWDAKLGLNIKDWADQQRTTLNKYL